MSTQEMLDLLEASGYSIEHRVLIVESLRYNLSHEMATRMCRQIAGDELVPETEPEPEPEPEPLPLEEPDPDPVE